MGQGLDFPLGGKYRPLTIAPLNPRKCWEAEFQYALREIAGDTYPQADYDSDESHPHVIFRKNWLGRDILGSSRPYDQRKPSPENVERVQEQIERLHVLATDPNVPADRREFFQNFQLPDPREMPECWRTTGFFRKRLCVIWGLSGNGRGSTFLPASRRSRDWEDQANRRSLEEAFGISSSGHWGRMFSGGDGGTWKRHGCLVSLLKCFLGLVVVALIIFLLRGCLSEDVRERKGVPSSSEVNVAQENQASDETNAPLEDPWSDRPMVSLDDPASDETNALLEDLLSDGPMVSSDDQTPGGQSDSSEEHASSDVQTDFPKEPSSDVPKDRFDGRQTPKVPRDDLDEPALGGREVSNLESVQALAFQFRVNEPRRLSGGNGDFAQVEFTVSPIGDLDGKPFVVSDWRVNNVIERRGESDSFVPAQGLRYDKTYTISAMVTVDGCPQRVEPYQWNMIEEPTWQILEVGRDESGDRRRYRIICCNSSSVQPDVKTWKVAFHPGGKNEGKRLEFTSDEKRINRDTVELDWGIGRYKGAYYLELTAELVYSVRGQEKRTTHVETFPFTHDSSVDGLTRAKYEVVIPNVYFCLATLNDGELINGTAFAISEKRLLSNYHVAVGAIPESYAKSDDYRVVGPVMLTNVKGQTYHARVEWSDRGRDLAVLVLCDEKGGETGRRLPGYLHLSEEKLVEEIRENAPRYVFALGYPKGTVCKGPPAFTDGKAERLFRRPYEWKGRRLEIETVLNYTRIECGYSGGPLIDYQTGTVLGVNFGGFVERQEGHKAASLATSVGEVRKTFPKLGVQ